MMPYTDRQWRALFAAVGREELLDEPWFADHAARIANAHDVYGALAGDRSGADDGGVAGAVRRHRRARQSGAQHRRDRRRPRTAHGRHHARRSTR